MNKRKLNVSGYRGVWGETLNDEIVSLYTRAFVKFTKEDTKKENPFILIGRDGRENGPAIREIVIRELMNLGVQVVDGDILPTPTVLFSVRKHKYDGAIIITASHNPIEYNGLKFVNKEALFTIEEEVEKINKYYEEEETGIATKNNAGLKISDIPNFVKEHVDQICENINLEAIRNKKFRVLADMINASACVIDPYLFEKMGIELVPVNNIPNGKFGHRPEPLRENLLDIEELVKKSNVDVGFVHDPDADRLVIVNEKGVIVSEECSISLAIENVISKNKGKNIVLNLSTSRRGEDIAQKYGSKCYRTKIGEGFVVEGILAHNAIIGGEGNGGIIYPTINTARDSFVGLALILELMAERNKKISELLEEIPEYFIKKEKWPVGGNLNEMYSKLKLGFKEAKRDEQDGLRLDFPDSSWIHLRPSNTEPIIKLFGEAKTKEEIEALFKETHTLLA